MKRFIIGCLLGTTALSAIGCYDTYFGVDGLWWKPTHCPIRVAQGTSILAVNLIVVKDFVVVGETDWGVRGHVGLRWCDWAVQLGYLYYKSQFSRSLDGSSFGSFSIPVIGGNLSSLRSFLKIDYQNVDLRFVRGLCDCRCTHLSAYGNARWVRLRLRNTERGIPRAAAAALPTLEQEAELLSGGPGMGLKLDVPLLYGLCAEARAGVTALIGSAEFRRLQLTDSEGSVTVVQPDQSNTIVPATDVALTICYDYRCGCFPLHGYAGYELHYFHRALTYTLQQTSTAFTSCEDMGFGGVTFGLVVSF